MRRRAVVALVPVLFWTFAYAARAQGEERPLTAEDVRAICQQELNEALDPVRTMFREVGDNLDDLGADLGALQDDLKAMQDDLYDLGDRVGFIEHTLKTQDVQAAYRLKVLELEKQLQEQARTVEVLKATLAQLRAELHPDLPPDPALAPLAAASAQPERPAPATEDPTPAPGQ